MEAFSGHLKKGGIKDIMLFFPPTKHDIKHLETHFKAAGLPQVVDFYIKRQYAIIKDSMTKHLKEMTEAQESPESVRCLSGPPASGLYRHSCFFATDDRIHQGIAVGKSSS